jgi:cobyrinic acid a,c-diamide synthase
MIERLSEVVSANVDIDRLITIADTAPIPDSNSKSSVETLPKPDVRIAIARDAAFGFYYPDDLRAFAASGAELIPFDALNDSHLPAADGLFIGGGFPETHLESLAANQGLLTDIRQKLAAGLPAYAECGGMMYLAKSIQWQDEKHTMAGVVPGDIFVAERPQGRGYVRLSETGKSLWPARPYNEQDSGRDIPAHEFHYARLENVSNGNEFAYQVNRGHGIDGHNDGLIIGNLVAGFAHHRNTKADPWVERFVAFVRETSQNTSSGDSP